MIALFIILPLIFMIGAGITIYFTHGFKELREREIEVDDTDWRGEPIKKKTTQRYSVLNTRKVFGFVSSIVLMVVSILILIFIPGSFHQINAGEVAVVKVWGDAKYIRTPGLHFDFWISHKYDIYDSKVQQTTVTTQTYSQDGQTMDIELVIQYKIQQDKAIEIAKSYGGLQMLESRIETVAIERMKSVLSQKSAMKIIETRANVSEDVTKAVTEAITNDYYANITTVVLTDISFSDAFEKTVEDKMIAEQEKLKAEYEKEKAIIQAEQELEVAKLEAQARLAKAQGDADAQKVIAEAEAYATQIKIIELARALGYEIIEEDIIEEDNSGEEIKTGIKYTIDWSSDTDGKGQGMIIEYLKYLEYLSKWNGELPDVVAGEDLSILLPTTK